MITYDNIYIQEHEYNTTIQGVNSAYTFLSVMPNMAKKYIEGKNILCLASCTNESENDIKIANFTHISFHEDCRDFFKTDSNWNGIHYMYFRFIKNVEDVDTIITDIKSKHPNCLFNNI